MISSELILLLVAAGLVLVALAVFVWSMYHDSIQYERLEMSTPVFDRAGFSMDSLPQESYLRLERIYLLGRKVAQMEFFIQPQWTAWLRVAMHGQELRLEDWAMPEFDQLAMRVVDGVRVELLQEQNGAVLIQWEKDGFDYALYLPQTEMGLAGGMMEVFVTDSHAKYQ